MGKNVLNVVKKVFGVILAFFCVMEVVVGIYNMNQEEIVPNIIGIIIAIFLFGVPAFFLLKPSKKKNITNSNLPFNQPSNANYSNLPSDQPNNTNYSNLPPNQQGNTTVCALCGKKLGFLSSKTVISDGVVCHQCLKMAGIYMMSNGQAFNTASLKKYLDRHAMVVRTFAPTKRVQNYIAVDEIHQSFRVGNEIFEYHNLLSYELLENGYVVLSGGLDRKFDGGLFFINKGNLRGICSSLQLKVNLRSSHIDKTNIAFIFLTIQKDTGVYEDALANAQSCVYVLQKIVEQVSVEVKAVQQAIAQKAAAQKAAAQNAKPQAAAAIDEFEKLYQLLHSGLITQEEFDAKKKQLLGL